MKPDVIVIGAGAAGLSAARVLSDGGCSVVIVEARDRIGGRIHTLCDPKLKMPIELGAEFVHGRPEVSWKMIGEAGLVAMDLPVDHKRFHRRRLVDCDVNAELNKVMGGLAHLGSRDKSFAQYLRDQRGGGAKAEARRFAVHFIEGFDAADPERISVQSVAEEHQGIGDIEDETQYRLLDGYGSLVDHLRRSLNHDRVKIRLCCPISEIHWQKSKVELLSDRGPGPLRAPCALITLPLGVMQLPPERPGAIRFSPEISKWRSDAQGLAFGSVVKAVLRFRTAFWEEKKELRNAAFLHHPAAAFPTWWTMRPLHFPILTAWAGGPKAVALARLTTRALMKAAVESLSPMVKISARRLSEMIEQFYFYDWGSDPLARGAYSYVAVGGMSARAKLAEPIDGTLFFAGEALDTSGQASTVAGAMNSGQRAARQILDRL